MASAPVLDDVEYMAWHVAATPTQEMMNQLLAMIVSRSAELASLDQDADVSAIPEIPGDAVDVSPNVVPVEVSETPEIPSEGHTDVPQGNVTGNVTGNVSEIAGTFAELSSDAKKCNACLRIQPIENFTRDATVKKDGRRGNCKACESARRRARRAEKAVRFTARVV